MIPKEKNKCVMKRQQELLQHCNDRSWVQHADGSLQRLMSILSLLKSYKLHARLEASQLLEPMGCTMEELNGKEDEDMTDIHLNGGYYVELSGAMTNAHPGTRIFYHAFILPLTQDILDVRAAAAAAAAAAVAAAVAVAAAAAVAVAAAGDDDPPPPAILHEQNGADDPPPPAVLHEQNGPHVPAPPAIPHVQNGPDVAVALVVVAWYLIQYLLSQQRQRRTMSSWTMKKRLFRLKHE